MDRFVCIHGHFYQPPRENPWLEDIELQDSAYPFHDWNERITAECYVPNTAARIQDRNGEILDIADNYSRISFNFGATLLSWMEKKAPDVYHSIIDADRESRDRFGGHGSAIAQAHGHLIMPLCNSRDKRTQVLWGIRDFVYRFDRQPEGMWLPETAVDLETLEVLADHDIKFTILAPSQAARVRRKGKTRWADVDGGRIDPKMPYLCRLPSGKNINLFFYDGPISQEIAFSDMLRSGENFAGRLTGTFSEEKKPQLVHIATDGETYGHHHRFGEMALAFCLRHLEEEYQTKVTIYGEYLEKHPPTHEVEIFEDTSWSCSHGVERWRADCGCRIGGNDWNQKWRAPLREALDWLRDRLIEVYEEQMGCLVKDPWSTRDAYIEVVLDRSQTMDFLRNQTGRELSREETVQALRLLEMQRQAMLMFTSCGWFFDDISGIESTQVLFYAGRAIQLAELTAGQHLEKEFLQRLKRAPSNVPRCENGARIYEIAVKPVRLDLIRVAAHHAIASMFRNGPENEKLYCYTATDEYHEKMEAGQLQISVGRTRIRSDITLSEEIFSYAVLHFGGHNLNAGIRVFNDSESFNTMRGEILQAFERSDIAGIIRMMDLHFATHNYTLGHLFRDEQRKILGQVMAETLKDIEDSFARIYNNQFTLVRFLKEINMPIPSQLALPIEIALNAQLRREIGAEEPDSARIRNLGEDILQTGIEVDQKSIRLAAGRQMRRQIGRLSEDPGDRDLLNNLCDLLEVFHDIPLEIDLWEVQNLYFALRERVLEELGAESRELFLKLGRLLSFKVE